MKRRETPHDVLPGQSPLDIGVVAEVEGIVDLHTAEPTGLRVNEQCGNREKQRQTGRAPPAADALLFIGRPGPLQFPVAVAYR